MKIAVGDLVVDKHGIPFRVASIQVLVLSISDGHRVAAPMVCSAVPLVWGRDDLRYRMPRRERMSEVVRADERYQ